MYFRVSGFGTFHTRNSENVVGGDIHQPMVGFDQWSAFRLMVVRSARSVRIEVDFNLFTSQLSYSKWCLRA